MEPEISQEPVPGTEEVKAGNFFSRLGGVYLSPRNTFQEIGRKPTVLVPIIATIVVGLLLGIYVVKTLDLASLTTAQMEKMVERGRITQEQMDMMLPGSIARAPVQTLVGSCAGGLIVALIIAGYAKLFSLFAGAENRFKTVFSVTLFTTIAISIVQSILVVLVLYFKGAGDVNVMNINSVVTSNLGAVLRGLLGEDALPKFVMGLATAVDVFAIWMIALLSIGYSAVSKKLKTATAAIWLVIAFAIIAVISAAFGAGSS